MRLNKPTIAVTMGDPAGIGPEVVLKALASPKIARLANFLLIGDGFVIKKTVRDLKLRLEAPFIDLANVPPESFSYGRIDPACGRAGIEYIDRAIELLKTGEAAALVTGPLNKAAVRAGGLSSFLGHTEYLAAKTHSKSVAMMFTGKLLKVTLVTRHLALKDVARSLSVDKVLKAILLTHRYLQEYFRIDDPSIGVTGLNPHAGEGGAFGSEEETIIAPAVAKAGRSSRRIIGPLPADVAFHDCLNRKFDAVVAMYHDQGLAPFKMLYFADGVNVTLGLPFARTSPDHGTAFDIAGKGTADPSSMIEAIRLACRLASTAAG